MNKEVLSAPPGSQAEHPGLRRIGETRAAFTARVENFSSLVDYFYQNAKVPAIEGSSKWRVAWDGGCDLTNLGVDDMARLERKMLTPEVIGRRWTQKDGLPEMADFFGLEGFAWDGFVAKEKFTNWAEVMQRATKVVVFTGGWMSETPVWQKLPAEIAEENPGTVCLVLTTPGFGRAEFANWDFARAANVYDTHGISLFVACWEKALGLRNTKKKVGHVSHSMMAKRLTDLPYGELSRKNRFWVAVCPARKMVDVGPGNYSLLEFATYMGSQIPFKKLPKTISNFLIRILTQAHDDVIEAHKIVAERAIEHERYDQAPSAVMEHLSQTQDFGIPKKRKWPKSFSVFLGTADRLVDSETVKQFLEEAGMASSKIFMRESGSHYFWAEARREESGQDREKLKEEINYYLTTNLN